MLTRSPRTRLTNWLHSVALLLAVVAFAIPSSVVAQDAETPEPAPAPDAGADDAGDDGTSLNRIDQEEKLPQWQQEWIPLAREAVGVTSLDPRDEEEEAEVAERIKAWLTQYANIDASSTDQAIDYLVNLITNFRDPNHLTAGADMVNELLKGDDRARPPVPPADLTTGQQRHLQAARMQALVDVAYFVPPSAKVMKYEAAVSQARTLVNEDLSTLTYNQELDLHTNYARALIKLGYIDQAVVNWSMSIQRADEGRRWGLMTSLVDMLSARDEHQRILELVPLVERIGGESHALETMAIRARALMFAGRDQEMHEVYATMAETAPNAMSRAREEAKKAWRARTGRQMPGFRLMEPGTDLAHDLSEYAGRHVLVVYVNLRDGKSRSAWMAAMAMADRYNERDLAVVTVSGGDAFGVNDETQLNAVMPLNRQTGNRERDPRIKGHFLVDELGSVSRSAGFGLAGYDLPGATLVNPSGSIVYNSSLTRRGAMLFLRDALEESIELAAGQGEVREPDRRVPGEEAQMGLLRSLYDELGVAKDSPVRRSLSVQRAGLLMGAEYRSDARDYLAHRARNVGADNRDLFMTLFERLLDEHFTEDNGEK